MFYDVMKGLFVSILVVFWLWLGVGSAVESVNSLVSVSKPPSTSAVILSQSSTIKTTKSTSTTSTVSCLYPVNPFLGNIGNSDGSDCMRPGNPDILEGYVNPYVWATWDRVMASSCSSVFQKSLDEFKATGVVTSYEITNMGEYDKPVQTETMIQYAEWFNYQPKAGSGCCLNCTVYGGNVQVYYWPTSSLPAIAPNATISGSTTALPPAMTVPPTVLVNDANFTLLVSISF